MTKLKIGFVGLGVMGEPICRNMLQKSGQEFTVHDLNEAAVRRLEEQGALAVNSVGVMAAEVDLLFLSLPGGAQVESVVSGANGIAQNGREGLTLVDLSTSPVALTRTLATQLATRGIEFADAPIARTRQAAEDGTLSIMVGATDAVFERVRPWLGHAASDVTHCGEIGCGQVAKILNNMVLFETVVALSEALALGRAAGMDGELLFDVLSKGSADSFALRNHGMKAILKDHYPTGAFSTDYALKDISYALDLAKDSGYQTPGADLARARLEKAKAAGFGSEYYPVFAKLVDRL